MKISIKAPLDKLFGETLDTGKNKISMPIIFTIILCTTTVFFFDHRTINIGDSKIHFSLGLIPFPLTFTIINLIQDRYGRLFANTVVRYAFFADLLFVLVGYSLSQLGERNDYLTVYKEIPIIMVSTFIFLWISNTINTSVFSMLKTRKINDLIKFSLAAILAETSVSMLSIPLMMYQNNITGGALLSITAVVIYKIGFTLILSFIISIRNYWKNRHL